MRKGEPGRNPLGAGAARAVFHRLTNERLKEIIEMAATGSLEEITRIANERGEGTSFMKSAVAKCLADAYNRSDWHLIEKIIERCVGKVSDKVEHTLIEKRPMTEEERAERKLRILEQAEKIKKLENAK